MIDEKEIEFIKSLNDGCYCHPESGVCEPCHIENFGNEIIRLRKALEKIAQVGLDAPIRHGSVDIAREALNGDG